MREKVKTHIKLLLKLGRLRGMPIAEGETLGAYSLRAGQTLNTKEYTLAKACALYEAMRFGEKTPSPRELCELEAYTQKAERSYLAACGFFKKLVYRIM